MGSAAELDSVSRQFLSTGIRSIKNLVFKIVQSCKPARPVNGKSGGYSCSQTEYSGMSPGVVFGSRRSAYEDKTNT